ncbi:hypothetical protein J2780_000372 [Chryseobacterium camelliae]|nr:hypothetical protein [Chryseobacterium camelliae]
MEILVDFLFLVFMGIRNQGVLCLNIFVKKYNLMNYPKCQIVYSNYKKSTNTYNYTFI